MKRRILMIIMGVALMALPTMAQDWQSTSSMQGSGSAYSAQVTAVGAAEVTDMATTTTTDESSSGPNRRRGKKWDEGGLPDKPTDPTPLGDAALPLLLLACAYLIMRATRTRAKKG